MTYDELIAALEAATGPSRELDAEIAAAIRFVPDGIGSIWHAGFLPNRPNVGRVECCTGLGTGGPHYAAAHYTASLDAALTLVPEGWTWTAGRRETGCGHAYMHNGKPHFVGIAAAPNPSRRHAEVRAATPALALCIASLRARQVTQ